MRKITWADVLWNQVIGNSTTAADPAGAVIASYTNVFAGYFYFLLMGLALTMIYMKNRNFTSVVIIALLLSSGIAVMVPATMTFAIIVMIALGVAYVLYRVFK